VERHKRESHLSHERLARDDHKERPPHEKPKQAVYTSAEEPIVERGTATAILAETADGVDIVWYAQLLFRYLAVVFWPLCSLGGKTFYFKISHKPARYLRTCSKFVVHAHYAHGIVCICIQT
jgi:hypothetical protein